MQRCCNLPFLPGGVFFGLGEEGFDSGDPDAVKGAEHPEGLALDGMRQDRSYNRI
jgi:hypothetical protein